MPSVPSWGQLMGRCESPVSGQSPAPLPTAPLGPHGFPSSASARLKMQQASVRLALNPKACHSTACQCSAQLRTEQGCWKSLLPLMIGFCNESKAYT